MGSWHIFLPSEMCFGYQFVGDVSEFNCTSKNQGLTSMLGLPRYITMISGCFENVSLAHLEFLDCDMCAMYKQLLLYHIYRHMIYVS